MITITTSFWFSGNQHDLEACAILGFLVFLEYRYKAISRLKKWDFVPFIYVPVSVTVFIAWAVVTFGFDLFHFSGNLIDYRVYGISTVGHYAVWLSIFFILLRYASWKDVISGWLIVGLFVSIHELTWYAGYFIAYPQNLVVSAIFYSPFLLLLVIFILGYWVVVPDKATTIFPTLSPEDEAKVRARKTFGARFEFYVRRIWRVGPRCEKLPRRTILVTIAVVFVFDAMWTYLGLPVTVDNVSGKTIWYANIFVNFLEDASWVLPTVVYCLG